VFERFARVDAGGRPGAGLGLAIVAKVAAAHGGRVELRSAPGEGSEFALLVPRGASARAGPANLAPGARKPRDRDFSRQDPGRDHPGGGKPIGRNSSGPNGAGQ
jgi:hypothetical protein